MSEPAGWAIGFCEVVGGSAAGGAFVALRNGDRIRDLRPDADRLGVGDLSSPDSTRALLQEWDRIRPELATLADETDGAWQPLDEVRPLAPLAPRQIIQAGANYRKHVIDLAVAHADIARGRTEEQVRQETAEMMDRRRAEGVPYFFIGLPSAVTGPTDDVTLPAYSAKHDWELELAVVIGRTAHRIRPEEALAHVACYTIVNDLTTRDLVFRPDMPEIGTDWFRAKNAPGFLPTGPWLVPADQIPDPQDVRITLTLNGDTMQDESTSDMIFDVAQLIAAASETLPLEPGDLLLTGSPAGNGAHWGRLLRDGDVMEATISGLGTQRTRVVAERVDA